MHNVRTGLRRLSPLLALTLCLGMVPAFIAASGAPTVHAALARNHCGQGERPPLSSLVTTWIGAQTRKSRISPPMRSAARKFS